MKDQTSALLNARSIWLVEDNAHYRESALRVLQSIEGVSLTRGFERAEDALEAIDQGGEPELLLLDVDLPGLSGIDSIAQFKARCPLAQVVILTVFEDPEKVFRAICAGADGYLLKDPSIDLLRETLLDIRRGGAPMNGRIARLILNSFARQKATPVDYHLTARERQVLEWLVAGLSRKEIAAQLEMSLHTVDFHQRSIYRKLRVRGSTAAITKAIREGLT